MSAVQRPGPEHPGDRRQPTLPLVLIDRWTQVAVERPWRYVAAWAIGIASGFACCSTTSHWPATLLAIFTAVGFLMFAWVYIAQLTRASRGQRPWPTVNAAIAEQSCATDWRAGSTGRRPGAGRGARSQWLWSCPRPVNAPARRVVGRPLGQSTSRRRRLVLAAGAAASPSPYSSLACRAEALLLGESHDVVVPSWRN